MRVEHCVFTMLPKVMLPPLGTFAISDGGQFYRLFHSVKILLNVFGFVFLFKSLQPGGDSTFSAKEILNYLLYLCK